MTIVLVVIIIIALIAAGLGIDFLPMLGILAGILVLLCIGIGLNAGADETSDKKKAKTYKIISKILFVAIPVTVLIILFISAGGCVGRISSTPEDKAYDDYMGGIDWGDDYYYDSYDNEVRKKAWK